MTKRQDAVVTAARALIGVRFRPQGRDPAIGLDCVGVALLALDPTSRAAQARGDYPQRGGDAAAIIGAIDRPSLARIPVAEAHAGALLLMEVGPGQMHLAIKTREGFVHADAALRRVVETPGRPPWPPIAAWRIHEENS